MSSSLKNGTIATDHHGAWLVAFKKEQLNQFQGLICSKKTADNIVDNKVAVKKSEPLKPILTSPQVTSVSFQLPEHKKFAEKELDGFFLLKHCAVDDPTDLCVANIEGCELCETKVDDLAMFDNVIVVKASDNMLSLEDMHYFPKLQELSIALNAIRGLQLQVEHFPQLQVLDVSFNNLSPEDIRTLGLLRNLRVLTASGNNLHSLPPMISAELEDEVSSIHDDESREELYEKVMEKMRRYEQAVEMFPKLEVLNLDNNRFADDRVFVALATLRRLRVLNLDKNEIRRVPYLQVVNGKAVVDDNATRKKRRKSPTKQKAAAQAEAPHSDGQSSVLVVDTAMQNLSSTQSPSDAERPSAAQQVAAMAQQKIEPAFCELTTLSLASNPIGRDSDLLALVGWPLLQRIVLHNTPLVESTSGDPPIVRKIFKERLGMQVVRKQTELQPTKPRVEIRRDKPERLHIKTDVIPIPKCDVEKLLAAYSGLAPSQDAPSSIQLSNATPEQQQVPSLPQQTAQQAQPFFVTQVDDKVAESSNRTPRTASTTDKSPAKSKPKKTVAKTPNQNNKTTSKIDEELQSLSAVPTDSLHGYEEILQDVPPDDELDETLPKDMNGTVAALRYSLHHPLLLDMDARIDRIVRPYHIPKKTLPTTKQTAAQLREQRTEKAYATLKSNQTVESFPLVGVLNQGKDKKYDSPAVTSRDRKEAKAMFARMGKQYEKVREQSLQYAFESLEKVAAEVEGMRQSIQRNVLRLTEERAEDRKREIEQLEAKLNKLDSSSTSSTSAVSVFMNKLPRSHAHFSAAREES